MQLYGSIKLFELNCKVNRESPGHHIVMVQDARHNDHIQQRPYRDNTYRLCRGNGPRGTLVYQDRGP